MEKKGGLFLVITDDSELICTMVHLRPRGMDVRVWCPQKASLLQDDILAAVSQAGEEELLSRGDITKPQYFTQFAKYQPVCFVLALKDEEKYEAARGNILKELPDAKILTLHRTRNSEPRLARTLDNDERELVLSWASLLSRPMNAELRHIQSTHCVKAVRDILEGGDKIALLLQPDPDPDGIASALALRTILGRNKLSTPLVTFGKVTRPENLAMMRLLDIDVQTIRPDDLEGFDRVALLDTQPAHFNIPLPRVDVVIDHHPLHVPYSIPYVDIRPYYGATSTILTEYLKAAAIPIGQRLATALLYGIKADTLVLNREVIDADLDAFVSLYPSINYNLLRRIEKPELPMKFAPILARALQGMATKNGILVSCLGKVEREDLIPQVADFLLQFEEVEWVICAGIFDDQVVMSVRNVGYVKNAGDVVKRIIGTWGVGGGHRSMAKAIFPANGWKKHFGSLDVNEIRDRVLKLFLGEVE